MRQFMVNNLTNVFWGTLTISQANANWSLKGVNYRQATSRNLSSLPYKRSKTAIFNHQSCFTYWSPPISSQEWFNVSWAWLLSLFLLYTALWPGNQKRTRTRENGPFRQSQFCCVPKFSTFNVRYRNFNAGINRAIISTWKPRKFNPRQISIFFEFFAWNWQLASQKTYQIKLCLAIWSKSCNHQSVTRVLHSKTTFYLTIYLARSPGIVVILW